MYDNRQHELILNTRIALFLGVLAQKMELVKFIFFVRFFFVSYLIMLPSGPSDSAFTQRGPKARVYLIVKQWITRFSALTGSLFYLGRPHFACLNDPA